MRREDRVLDEYLAAAARTGDRAALGELARRWEMRLLRHAWRLIGDADEARDVAQDAWVDHSNEVGNSTLYPKANSWYMGANVPGKVRVFTPYIGGVGPYREKCVVRKARLAIPTDIGKENLRLTVFGRTSKTDDSAGTTETRTTRTVNTGKDGRETRENRVEAQVRGKNSFEQIINDWMTAPKNSEILFQLTSEADDEKKLKFDGREFESQLPLDARLVDRAVVAQAQFRDRDACRGVAQRALRHRCRP